MTDFALSYPVALILSLALVVFLSLGLIKKLSGPIEILQEATHHIAAGRFGHKVAIHSGDEFETLGAAFNQMSAKVEEGQALLVRSAKMATMGQMAAGILHEIKQPLAAIHGHIQMAMMDLDTPEQRARLGTIMEALERLDGILNRFGTFSHMSTEKVMPLGLDQVVDRVYRLMAHQLMRNSIRFTVDQPEALSGIVGDSGGLQQVFSNLFINAIHALETKPKDQRELRVGFHQSHGQVCVDVQDNGCGIGPEAQARIFDPFFTTKDPGKGTGLGMAIVASILHRHGATITFTSQLGAGTTFSICFPTQNQGTP